MQRGDLDVDGRSHRAPAQPVLGRVRDLTQGAEKRAAGAVAAWVELALGVAVEVFAVVSAVSRRGGTAPEEEKPPARNAWALYVTALVFVGIVVFDPPFDIHVAVAATQPLPVMVLGWVAWALISQIALTLLLLLTALGRQERFSAVMQRAWARISPWVGVAVTVLLALAALFLVLDAGRFLSLDTARRLATEEGIFTGISAGATVAAALQVAKDADDGAVILALTGDEEGEGVDGTTAILDWMAERGERMAVCLVGEPTCPERMGEMMKIGRRGSLTVGLTATGVQGHAAYPQRAKNPVHDTVITCVTSAAVTPGAVASSARRAAVTNMRRACCV